VQIVIADRKVIVGSETGTYQFSGIIDMGANNAAVLQLQLLSNAASGEASAAFQGSNALNGTYGSIGPSPITVGTPGEVRSLYLDPASWPFIRIRFSSAIEGGTAVYNAILTTYKAN
jgi:hypothetical protein